MIYDVHWIKLLLMMMITNTIFAGEITMDMPIYALLFSAHRFPFQL
jgi:hypothetical protein